MLPPINIATLGTMLPVPAFLGDIHRPRHSSSYPGSVSSLTAPQPNPPSRHLLFPLQGSVPITCWPPGSVPCYLSPLPHTHTVICCSPTPGYSVTCYSSPELCPVTYFPSPRLCPWLLSPVTGEIPGSVPHLLLSPFSALSLLLAAPLSLCPHQSSPTPGLHLVAFIFCSTV